jgi:hypothetical protein
LSQLTAVASTGDGVGNDVSQQLAHRPALSGRQRGDAVPEILVKVDGGGVLSGFVRIRHSACIGACLFPRNARFR